MTVLPVHHTMLDYVPVYIFPDLIYIEREHDAEDAGREQDGIEHVDHYLARKSF